MKGRWVTFYVARRFNPKVTFLNCLTGWWDEKPLPAEVRLLWKKAELPIQITPGKIHVITLCDNWGIWTEDFETDIMGIEASQQSAKVALQGTGDTKLTILHRNPYSLSAQTKLQARSRKGNLRLVPSTTHGLWQTQVDLEGPDFIEIDVRE